MIEQLIKGMTKKEYMKKYHKVNGDRLRAQTRQWYRESIKSDPYYNRRRNLSKFGLTLEEYDKMVKVQNNLCAICDRPGEDKRDGWSGLHVDHNYKLGKKIGRRLLLCSNCNTALGLFKESITTLENAIAYLEYFNAK